MKKVIVIGGGLAGLVSSILLVRKGLHVTLIEEKKYPFHRVCGEYVSNEVIPFLKKNGLFPEELKPAKITQFHLTSPSGTSLKMPLDLGGFGISRYAFDQWLFDRARSEGVDFHWGRVTSVKFEENFTAKTKDEFEIHADLAIGAFGKRSHLDKGLNREFTQKSYPYVGVKYHLRTAEADGEAIALHNFKDGYCGISRVEDDKFNLCYLTHRDNLKRFGSIPTMEHNVLSGNPFLRRLFDNSEFLFDKPEVINEISFYPKEPVFNHILMAGDSAGMIAPLCGNGMAMAIHSAKLLSELILENISKGFDLEQLEVSYHKAWSKAFQKRLWIGRNIQHMFGAIYVTEFAVAFNNAFPKLARSLMKRTHGKVF